MNFRSFAVAVVVATALVAAPARAQDARESGWNTKHAMLFSVQNVFSDGNGILDAYEGGVGVQRNLSPVRALRFSVSLSRSSNPPYEIESQTAGGAVVKQDVVPGITSAYSAGVRGSYLMRLSPGAIAPYLGAGALLRFSRTARAGTDDDTAGTKVVYDDSASNLELGLVGQLGLEWRLHRTVAIFAEYGLEVIAMDRTSDTDRTSVNGSTTRSEFTQTRYFNFSTGLEQGGQLGLVAFF